jgi:hypothetical protein
MEPEIKVLSYSKRQRFFNVLLGVFIVALPVLIFYTSGYRLDFSDDSTNIITTGGIYVTTDNLDVEVYLDDAIVKRPRLFRSAYYIQNIESGMHKIVVQQPLLHTWVKTLSVDSNIVTEAAPFNVPLLPHIRPIPRLLTTTGTGLYVAKSTTTPLFPKATTTGDFLVVTKVGTTTTRVNKEYEYVSSLFASTTLPEQTLRGKIEEEIEKFTFIGSSTATTTKEDTLYVEQGNMQLVLHDGELYARWKGPTQATPHYFCTALQDDATIAARYGTHIAEQIAQHRLSTTTPLHIENDRQCRTEVRIDRKWQAIQYYEFLPNSSDLVLLQLEDGLYLTEIDDRAWQNTQLLYPGESFRTIVTDTNIYIEEDGRYFELFTKTASS